MTTPRTLTQAEHNAINAVTIAVGVLGVIGFVNSFKKVMDAAAPTFGGLAFTVPLGIDLGILAFSALDIVLARMEMRIMWLRLIPWALTGATVYLNIASEETLFGVVAHATLPLLWVIAVEVGAHVVRKRAKLSNPTRMDKIRISRWILAPLRTFGLWRRMVLWEIRSYSDALGRERDRVLAKTDLQDQHGRLWRWKATRRERALYRLGELAPVTQPRAIEAGTGVTSPAPVPAEVSDAASGTTAGTVGVTASGTTDGTTGARWRDVRVTGDGTKNGAVSRGNGVTPTVSPTPVSPPIKPAARRPNGTRQGTAAPPTDRELEQRITWLHNLAKGKPGMTVAELRDAVLDEYKVSPRTAYRYIEKAGLGDRDAADGTSGGTAGDTGDTPDDTGDTADGVTLDTTDNDVAHAADTPTDDGEGAN
ncbi:hypothetical protein HD597_006716 [Nonomuraea thailandensis]|uniref:DUF2637 domain-containing protein n=1 Tax=Nonomuraea thailandensis TaxID=1188745 RepID=A0A9X2K7E1_9ACTN|nr:DUF2637 domain-containing protein [Nonomuraea thailandensis]MCP2359696.1 hypothetical protein [Nonomuraea thailandensis]